MSDAPEDVLAAVLSGLLPSLQPDPLLLRQALTHRSFRIQDASAPDSERLELLGDAVLSLAVSEELLRRLPYAREGELSRRRAGMVREEALALLARRLGLGDLLLLSRSEAADGGREKDSLLADAFEAMLGAVFLSCGYPQAASLTRLLLEPFLSGQVPLLQDAKTRLQERTAMLSLPLPLYRSQVSGPDHAPLFQVQVSSGPHVASGSGGSRKAAEQDAARALLELLAP